MSLSINVLFDLNCVDFLVWFPKKGKYECPSGLNVAARTQFWPVNLVFLNGLKFFKLQLGNQGFG